MHLDHTIIPTSNELSSAAFYSEILGLKNLGQYGDFRAVQGDDNLTLLFGHKTTFSRLHFAFNATAQEYATILARIKKHPDIRYGDSPSDRSNSLEYHNETETGFYFDDEDEHILEVIKLHGL